MKTKVLQVFYNENGLPFKDQERTVHFPVIGSGFMGASNTTQIKFYFKEIGDDAVKYVAVSKLPNGKVGSKVLENYYDSELDEPYALLELDSYYTQYKGDLFISLQGYQGGVQVTYDEDTELYEIEGTPTIQATGSIKFTNNYATQFVGSGEEQNITLQKLLAIISDTVLRYYVNPSNTLAEVFNEIGTKICAIDIEGDEYLCEMSGDTNIVIYDIHNQEWYAFTGANTTTIDEVMSSDNKHIIATKEDLENFGNLFTYKGTASVSEINALTDIDNGWAYNLNDSGTLTLGNLQVETGDNVAFNGTIWTKLSSETVLGNYYTKQEGQAFEQDVNEQINAVENQVQQVAQGSPKGVYATLSDLETAYPTGAEGIYVVQADGHWYYWSGSAWTDGGVYQATGIASNSIVNDMIVDNTITGNKISPDKLFTREDDLSGDTIYVDGKYMSTVGTENTYATLSYGQIDVSGYRYIEYSSFTTNKYQGSYLNNVACFRDVSGTVISADTYWDDIEIVDEANKILRVKVPENAKTFYFNIFTADKSSAVVKGLVYNSTKKINWIEVSGEQIEDESIEPTKLVEDSYGEDLASVITDGCYYSQSSYDLRYIPNTSISLWEFQVEENKKYFVHLSTNNPDTVAIASYFIFANQQITIGQDAGGTATVLDQEKSNYIEKLNANDFIVTMPAGTTYFYTASGINAKTNYVKPFKSFSFGWLALETSNFVPNTIPENAIIKGETTKYKYWDSLNKPFDFNNKTLVAFGDSITAGTYNEGSGNQSTTTLSYIALFATKFGMTLNNRAVSGSRFTAGGQYGSITTRITDFTFANTNNEVVIIAGGTNDFNSGAALGQLGDTTDATFYGALDVVCQYLTTNAPNSTIIFITPINLNRNESAFPNATNPLNAYRNAIWEVATKYKFNVVDGSTIGFAKEVNTPWGNLMISPNDGTHPTLAGHSLYFRGLCGKLE